MTDDVGKSKRQLAFTIRKVLSAACDYAKAEQALQDAMQAARPDTTDLARPTERRASQ